MLILCLGDTHLRDDVPVCRTDDYQAEQKRKMKWIISLIHKRKVDIVLHSGDLFDHWKPSLSLISWIIKELQTVEKFYGCAGNHDLPQHNLELLRKSGYGVLEAAKVINNRPFPNLIIEEYGNVIVRVPWGCEVPQCKLPIYRNKFKILIYHALVYEGRPPYPGAEKDGGTASSLLKKYPEYDLILTGHNHQTIVARDKDRYLINPGGMMRMTAAQIDHKPCVFMYDTETGNYIQEWIPIEDDVVSRDHLTVGEEKDDRVDAFLARLRDNVELKLSFRDNLKTYIAENNIRPAVVEKIMEALDDNVSG